LLMTSIQAEKGRCPGIQMNLLLGAVPT